MGKMKPKSGMLTDFERHNHIKEIYRYLEKIVADYDIKLQELSELLQHNTDENERNDNSFVDMLDKMLEERVRLEEKILSARIELVKNISKDELLKILEKIEMDRKK